MKIKKLITLTLIISLTFFNTTSFAIENYNDSNNILSTELRSDENSTQLSELNNSNNNENFENQVENLQLYCESCLLVECSTGKIAYTKNSDKKMYPASTAKLLTALIALENCNLDDTVTITTPMISPIPTGYAIAYLKPGENYTVEQLLNLLLIPSANDAGFALAIHISGSVQDFSILMNKTAQSLGCTNSNFTNPSGIHDENHYSTAKDMAIIGMEALRYKAITEIALKKEYNINNITFKTTNTLRQENSSNYYEYATGLKTGFTAPAGSCIIATAEKNNMKYLAVVLNSPEPTSDVIYRDLDCKTLFEYGFENFNEITFEPNNYLKLIYTNFFNFDNLKKVYLLIIIVFTLFLLILILKYIILRKNKES